MKRVIFVTSHYLESKSKAGFHWLADAFWQAGWDVTFFTASLSWLSWLRGDSRFQYPVRREARRPRLVRERLTSYVWLTPWHPGNLRFDLGNRLSRKWFARYGELSMPGIEERVAGADLVVFDSTNGLLLFDRFKRLNPRARYVYRVSDDLAVEKNHPVLLDTEERIASHFDLISTPSRYIYRRFAHLAAAALHKHAVNKELFDRPVANPFQGSGPHVLFVGRHFFDHDFFRRATVQFPEWMFHVVGPIAGVETRANVVAHGELPFAQTVPYLKHADIGLQNLRYLVGAESFTDSLKMHQYTYCGLPIVAPRFLQAGRSHVLPYEPGDDRSISSALRTAARFDRRQVPRHEVWTWQDLIGKLVA